MADLAKHTVLRLTQQEFGDWLELHGRRLYKDFYAQLRADLDETLRRQEARWQSLNARVAELANALRHSAGERADGKGNEARRVRQALEGLTAAVAALQCEVAAQRTAHRDPFGVFAVLLRDLPPESVRAGHVLWHPKTVDAYLHDTWQLTDPERRRYKAVWREARLIAVERESFTRKFTIARGVVAYRFAVPMKVFDLFHVTLAEPVSAEGAADLERTTGETQVPDRNAVA